MAFTRGLPLLSDMTDETRQYIANLALALIGTPYVWGGDKPYKGLDCSGEVIWILKVFGLLPPDYDDTADGISKYFPRTQEARLGDLVCYGSNDRVVHIGIYIGSGLAVSARGGDHTVTSVEIAKQKNASTRTHPVTYRRDFLFYLDIDRKSNGDSKS